MRLRRLGAHQVVLHGDFVNPEKRQHPDDASGEPPNFVVGRVALTLATGRP